MSFPSRNPRDWMKCWFWCGTTIFGLILGLHLFTLRPLAAPEPQAKRILRIAADPNNLPFSNIDEEGFENRIARIIANDLGAEIQYTWHAQRRGFFRETVKQGPCDLVIGVPGWLRTDVNDAALLPLQLCVRVSQR